MQYVTRDCVAVTQRHVEGPRPPPGPLCHLQLLGGHCTLVAKHRLAAALDNPTLQGVSPIAAPQITRKLTACRNWKEVIGVFREHREQLVALHVCAALSTLAKLNVELVEQVEISTFEKFVLLLMDWCEGNFELLSAREIANIVWAVGKLRQKPADRWVATFLAASQASLQANSAQELATMLHGYACMQISPGSAWLHQWLASFEQRLITADAQSLSNAAWSLSRLRHAPEAAWLQNFAVAFVDLLPDFTEQGLCITAWGLARMGYKPTPAWATCFFQTTLDLLPYVATRTVSTLLYAVATMCDVGTADPAWLTAAAAALTHRHSQLSTRGVLLALFAFAKLRHRLAAQQARLLLALTHQLLPRMTPQGLSMLGWSLGHQFIWPDQHWLDDYCAATMAAMPGTTAQGLATTALVLARFRAQPSRAWLKALLERTAQTLPDFNAKDIGQLIWALYCFQQLPGSRARAALHRAALAAGLSPRLRRIVGGVLRRWEAAATVGGGRTRTRVSRRRPVWQTLAGAAAGSGNEDYGELALTPQASLADWVLQGPLLLAGEHSASGPSPGEQARHSGVALRGGEGGMERSVTSSVMWQAGVRGPAPSDSSSDLRGGSPGSTAWHKPSRPRRSKPDKGGSRRGLTPNESTRGLVLQRQGPGSWTAGGVSMPGIMPDRRNGTGRAEEEEHTFKNRGQRHGAQAEQQRRRLWQLFVDGGEEQGADEVMYANVRGVQNQ